mmetsp:Transcript_117037/g.303478  ORF Transcript_117037/g.303478 Transcript_117037/m.303478 type:complete len:238 (+) Transcript_117037:2570-3283(+)
MSRPLQTGEIVQASGGGGLDTSSSNCSHCATLASISWPLLSLVPASASAPPAAPEAPDHQSGTSETRRRPCSTLAFDDATEGRETANCSACAAWLPSTPAAAVLLAEASSCEMVMCLLLVLPCSGTGLEVLELDNRALVRTETMEAWTSSGLPGGWPPPRLETCDSSTLSPVALKIWRASVRGPAAEIGLGAMMRTFALLSCGRHAALPPLAAAGFAARRRLHSASRSSYSWAACAK